MENPARSLVEKLKASIDLDRVFQDSIDFCLGEVPGAMLEDSARAKELIYTAKGLFAFGRGYHDSQTLRRIRGLEFVYRRMFRKINLGDQDYPDD